MVLLNAETVSASAARAMESSVAAVNSKRLDSWHKHEQIALAMEKQKSKLGKYSLLYILRVLIIRNCVNWSIFGSLFPVFTKL